MELRLLILGLLYEQDLHPYEVLQILKQRQVHEYIKVNYGTLYYAFDQMEKKGWIEVKQVIQEDRRPEKRIYRITPDGRKQLKKLLHQAFRNKARMYHPLYPALMNGHLADAEQVEDAIRDRLAAAREQVKFLRWLYEVKAPDHPFSVVMLVKNALMHCETEMKWLEEFLSGVQAGRL
ncbi:PadR family transcriptional regulator [Effusibacillus pohliae]|uniref:PadR family transcriptional regulator n=1 Tax=Effusibacillus pohliae TaxID=232270 RepID=UPI000365AAEA|nr:PadR family transcriptional regulator [Effusibacillus pohliae]